MDYYCGSCNRGTTKKMMHAGPRNVAVCARCDSISLFPHVRAYVISEHERVMKMVNCDHQFEKGPHHSSRSGVCDYCQLPEDHPLVVYSQQKD